MNGGVARSIPGRAEYAASAQVVDERRRALRALLQHPLLAAGGSHAAELGLVRRHKEWLRDWLARNPGWALVVDSEVARLHKVAPDGNDGTRAARDPKNGTIFTRRCYVLFCLGLAALERADRQTTLGRLAEAVGTLVSADPAFSAAGVRFDLSTQDQRRDLVHVVRLLLELRVLVRVEGDEQRFVAGQGDVLYAVRRPVLARVASFRRGPSTIEAESHDRRISLFLEETFPDSDEGRNRRLRSSLTRRLLDDPIVYYEDLSNDERAYLTSQRSFLLRQACEAAGLAAEVRREGIALVDEDGELTDVGLPEEGTEGHLTLLLAEFLAERVRRAPGEAVGYATLQRHTADLIAEHCHRHRHWRRDVGLPGAEVGLVEQTIGRLVALRLVRRVPEGVVPLPVIARFALAEPAPSERSEESLQLSFVKFEEPT